MYENENLPQFDEYTHSFADYPPLQQNATQPRRYLPNNPNMSAGTPIPGRGNVLVSPYSRSNGMPTLRLASGNYNFEIDSLINQRQPISSSSNAPNSNHMPTTSHIPGTQQHGPIYAPPSSTDYNPSYNPTSATTSTATPTTNHQHQTQKPRKSRAPRSSAHRPLAPAKQHGASTVAPSRGASHSGHASPANAAAVASPPELTLPSKEINGLFFDSHAAALAEIDLRFRNQLNVKGDDDLFEFERNKRLHVKSLVDALKHDGFIAPPQNWGTKDADDKPVLGELTAENKQEWTTWQEAANRTGKLIVGLPDADYKVEYCAWQIFEEFVKVHTIGYRITDQTADVESKCSVRLEDAIRCLKDYPIVRKTLLYGKNFSNFVASPKACGKATVKTHRSNVKRTRASRAAKKDKTGETTEKSAAQGRRAATNTGRTAKRNMPGKDTRKPKKDQVVNADDEDATEAEGNDDGEAPRDALQPVTMAGDFGVPSDDDDDDLELLSSSDRPFGHTPSTPLVSAPPRSWTQDVSPEANHNAGGFPRAHALTDPGYSQDNTLGPDLNDNLHDTSSPMASGSALEPTWSNSLDGMNVVEEDPIYSFLWDHANPCGYFDHESAQRPPSGAQETGDSNCHNSTLGHPPANFAPTGFPASSPPRSFVAGSQANKRRRLQEQ